MNGERDSILVVDDAPETVEVLQRNLSSKGFRVFTAAGIAEATTILASQAIDLVITDLRMPKASGFDLIKHVRSNFKEIEVMMITGYPSIEGAVEAVKLGAEEYLAKPFTDEELFEAVDRALKKLSLKRSARELQEHPIRTPHGLIGESDAMKKVLRTIPKAAATLATFLISGESGTGKELVARAIHYSSPRASAPFVPVNCGGIPEGLIESELFGHVKGAFTNASESRIGFFQSADKGTIFLDEISEVSPSVQVKLLRILQDKQLFMVGTSVGKQVDVRIVAATNKDLQSLVKKGLFREDLFFRINVITVTIPPLRERSDDVLLLVNHFAAKFSKEVGREIPVFTPEAYRIMSNYPWPGNVRELENLIQHLMIMVDEPEIDVPDFPVHMRYSFPKEIGFARTLSEVEAMHIKNVLEQTGWNKSQAAEILGIDRKTLREKMKVMDYPSR